MRQQQLRRTRTRREYDPVPEPQSNSHDSHTATQRLLAKVDRTLDRIDREMEK